MQVPEAAMNENDCFVFLQYQVRLAQEFLIVQTITIATSEQLLAEQYFRLSVFATDRRHIATAGGFVVNVSHTVIIWNSEKEIIILRVSKEYPSNESQNQHNRPLRWSRWPRRRLQFVHCLKRESVSDQNVCRKGG